MKRPDRWLAPDTQYTCDCGRVWTSAEEAEHEPGYDNSDGIGLPDTCLGCRMELILNF